MAVTMLERELLPEAVEIAALFTSAPQEVRVRFAAYAEGYLARMREEQSPAPEQSVSPET